MNAANRGGSTPQSIAHALRDDLLDGAIAPGARLTEEVLTERFGSGRHSVRSALQLLVSEGLLEHRRNRGIVVPDVTEARIDDMCAYRLILEMGALRLALAKGADFTEVSRAVDRLAALSPDAPWRVISEAHSAIHHAIVEAGGSTRLLTAHGACQNELNAMLATIRTDYTVRRLTVMHRELADKLTIGGAAALHALEDDLELGGRAAMLLALRRQRGSSG